MVVRKEEVSEGGWQARESAVLLCLLRPTSQEKGFGVFQIAPVLSFDDLPVDEVQRHCFSKNKCLGPA